MGRVMYTNQIKMFITVADCGSFARAAEKLYVSATAVMKQMNMLERGMSIKLLERTNQGVRLTEAGKSLYKDAKYIVQYADAAVLRAKKAEESSQFTIRVGTSMLNPCKPLMDIWGEKSCQDCLCKIKIVPFDDDHKNILSVVESIGRDFDFIVAACGSNEWLKRVNFLKLRDLAICCAVPRTHKLASKKRLNFSDLYGERLIMCRQGDSAILDKLRADIEENHPQIQIEDTDYFYDIEVFNRCEQTNSVLLTLESWADIHFSLATIPVDWSYTQQYGLLYPKQPSIAVKKFLELIEMA